jgi:putative two-component system response regulator
VASVATRIARLGESRLETLKRLAKAAEFRDDTTCKHTERVARTAVLVGKKLGLPSLQLSLIEEAAPLHDLGKLGIPDMILLKAGRLSRAEFEQVKDHPIVGAAILRDASSPVLRLAEEIALTHHEWWDGSGYPAGLQGDATPISGRIVALADVFDALTHPRPYKRPWPVDRAVREIRRLRGRQFEPAVVEAFLELDPKQLVGTPG